MRSGWDLAWQLRGLACRLVQAVSWFDPPWWITYKLTPADGIASRWTELEPVGRGPQSSQVCHARMTILLAE